MEMLRRRGELRAGVRNCDLLEKFIRWERWTWEGEAVELAGKKLKRGRTRFRGWCCYLPMLEVDCCSRDKTPRNSDGDIEKKQERARPVPFHSS
jgi:hypothetical protein